MKIIKKNLIYCGIICVLGIGISVAGVYMEDDLLKSIGIALIIVSLLKIAQLFILTRNDERRRKYELSMTEERIKYIASKSSSFVFYITVFCEVMAALILLIFGHAFAAGIVCYVAGAQVVLYLVLYIIFSRKY
ncbi:MAG: hypothetical protein PHV38_02770 [Eubacteriales bacterium]|nr:hypothetical protein [Eubacteriales bacterium]